MLTELIAVPRANAGLFLSVLGCDLSHRCFAHLAAHAVHRQGDPKGDLRQVASVRIAADISDSLL